MLRYPAKYEPAEEGGFVVTFRDIPEAITQGDDLEDARKEAAGALLDALDFYFEDQRTVPAPSKLEKGEEYVELPASASAKVLLLNEMLAQKVRPADLARLMHTTRQEVNRIVDLHHTTKIDTIGEAFQKLGRRLELRIA